jgi:hypothetical protein
MTKVSWKLSLVGIVVMMLVLLSFRAAVHHFDPITAVEMGMSPATVTHLMGAPLSASQTDGSTVYSYAKAKIFFHNGKVIAIVQDIK